MQPRWLTARFRWSDQSDEWLYYHVHWRVWEMAHEWLCRGCYMDDST